MVAWATRQGKVIPGVERVVAIPNGAYLAGSPRSRAMQWARLKAAGAKKGAADLFWPVPRQGFHGLFVEMKAPRPHSASVSAEQREFLDAVVADGYRGEVCRGAEEAIAVLMDYFGGE